MPNPPDLCPGGCGRDLGQVVAEDIRCLASGLAFYMCTACESERPRTYCGCRVDCTVLVCVYCYERAEHA